MVLVVAPKYGKEITIFVLCHGINSLEKLVNIMTTILHGGKKILKWRNYRQEMLQKYFGTWQWHQLAASPLLGTFFFFSFRFSGFDRPCSTFLSMTKVKNEQAAQRERNIESMDLHVPSDTVCMLLSLSLPAQFYLHKPEDKN